MQKKASIINLYNLVFPLQKLCKIIWNIKLMKIISFSFRKIPSFKKSLQANLLIMLQLHTIFFLFSFLKKNHDFYLRKEENENSYDSKQRNDSANCKQM